MSIVKFFRNLFGGKKNSKESSKKILTQTETGFSRLPQRSSSQYGQSRQDSSGILTDNIVMDAIIMSTIMNNDYTTDSYKISHNDFIDNSSCINDSGISWSSDSSFTSSDSSFTSSDSSFTSSDSSSYDSGSFDF